VRGFGRAVGRVVNLALVVVLWLTVVAPTAIVLRLLGRPSLDVGGARADSYWTPREPPSTALEDHRRPW
jgi:hypothetical protein